MLKCLCKIALIFAERLGNVETQLAHFRHTDVRHMFTEGGDALATDTADK